MRLLREAFPDRPVRDMAVTHALLDEVAGGAPAAVRIFRPGPTLAFGRLDRRNPGFAAAAAAARAHGFTPVLRLGGGHAAAYDEGSVLVERVVPVASVAGGLQERFTAATDELVTALRALGVPAVVGELPGEYCAGTFSVHAGGPPKLAGTAQRVVRGAALGTAFVAVRGGARLRAVLVDVYAALGITWDARTAGAAEDVTPGVAVEALAAELAARSGATPAALSSAVLTRAAGYEHDHAV